MPFFEVKLTALCVALVEAPDASSAMDMANERVFLDDYQFIESEVGDPIEGSLELDSARRHADVVLS